MYNSAMKNSSQHPFAGLLLGFLGVVIFSQTFPMSKLALLSFSPYFISLGRAFLAGLAALIIVLVRKESLPARSQIKPLFVTGFCVAVGFPLMSSLALQKVPAFHGAVVLGLIPFLTSIFETHGEKLPLGFWLSALAGSLTVAFFALSKSQFHLNATDTLFVTGTVVVAYGYVRGAELSRERPGWWVMSWALILCLPLSGAVSFLSRPDHWAGIPELSWMGFLYLGLMSQLLGYFFWYSGLALGGVAEVSQIQLLQGFLAVVGSAVYLGENITAETWVCVILVVFSIYFSRRALRNV
jgi:drug/metabolite transporter (DMT)-like permease